MTADLGLGANVGIEDAVSLCNILHRELAANRARHPDGHELSSMFAEFQAARYERVKSLVELSGKATRMHTYDSLFGRFFVGYVAPYLTKYQVMMLAKILAEAPKLDYVPVRTINEDAEGWKLAGKTRGTVFSTRLGYVVVGVTVACVILSRVWFAVL
jgi:FAD dependent monooxygenase